jgi:predicted transcriptional regulator
VKADTYSSTDPDNYITITTNLNKGKYMQDEDIYMSMLITLSNYYSYEYSSNWIHMFDIKFYNMLEENLSYSPPTLSTNNSFNTSQKGAVIYDDASYFVGKIRAKIRSKITEISSIVKPEPIKAENC